MLCRSAPCTQCAGLWRAQNACPLAILLAIMVVPSQATSATCPPTCCSSVLLRQSGGASALGWHTRILGRAACIKQSDSDSSKMWECALVPPPQFDRPDDHFVFRHALQRTTGAHGAQCHPCAKPLEIASVFELCVVNLQIVCIKLVQKQAKLESFRSSTVLVHRRTPSRYHKDIEVSFWLRTSARPLATGCAALPAAKATAGLPPHPGRSS